MCSLRALFTYSLFIMFVDSLDSSLVAAGETDNALDLLTKNTLTTAGVLIGSGAAMAGATLLTVALPAQMLTAAAVSGGLIFAGDRQAKGLSFNPFANSEAAARASDLPVVEKSLNGVDTASAA